MRSHFFRCVYVAVPGHPATVSLVQLPDARVLQRIRSGKNGFAFYRLNPGGYLLITSYLGYSTDTMALTLLPSDSAGRQVRVRLGHSSRALMEVVVHAIIPPVIVRSDTIAFNTAAFPTRPNATVEDL